MSSTNISSILIESRQQYTHNPCSCHANSKTKHQIRIMMQHILFIKKLFFPPANFQSIHGIENQSICINGLNTLNEYLLKLQQIFMGGNPVIKAPEHHHPMYDNNWKSSILLGWVWSGWPHTRTSKLEANDNVSKGWNHLGPKMETRCSDTIVGWRVSLGLKGSWKPSRSPWPLTPPKHSSWD